MCSAVARKRTAAMRPARAFPSRQAATVDRLPSGLSGFPLQQGRLRSPFLLPPHSLAVVPFLKTSRFPFFGPGDLNNKQSPSRPSLYGKHDRGELIKLIFKVFRPHTDTMRRRSAPSPLRLCPPGPVPRGTPKFVMPTIPLPTFQPVSVLPSTTWTPSRRSTHRDLPPLDISQHPVSQEQHQVYGHNPPGSTSSISSTLSWDSKCPSPINAPVRGPWDHSGSMGSKLDLANVLAPPKPVAISP